MNPFQFCTESSKFNLTDPSIKNKIDSPLRVDIKIKLEIKRRGVWI